MSISIGYLYVGCTLIDTFISLQTPLKRHFGVYVYVCGGGVGGGKDGVGGLFSFHNSDSVALKKPT